MFGILDSMFVLYNFIICVYHKKYNTIIINNTTMCLPPRCEDEEYKSSLGPSKCIMYNLYYIRRSAPTCWLAIY